MKKEALRVSSPPAPGPFDAALVETGRFPDHEETPEFVRNELRPWLRKLAHEHSLQPAAWIQGADLHEGNAADLVRKHGAQWIPETGLGVWPDREPPRLWSAEDFHELDPGQKIRPMMYTVFHVSGGTEASEHALSTLAGSGTLITPCSPLLRKSFTGTQQNGSCLKFARKRCADIHFICLCWISILSRLVFPTRILSTPGWGLHESTCGRAQKTAAFF